MIYKNMSGNIFCLPGHMIDAEFHEPYITRGYRKPEMSLKDCLKSTFIPSCNECFNVWSHLLFGLFFLLKYWRVFTQEFNIMDPFVWPLFTFAVGMTLLCFMSTCAHTFNSMSPYVRHKCFYLDYAAISIYGVGVNQAFYFYARPLDASPMLFSSPTLFMTIALLNSAVGTYFCCVSRTCWRRLRYLIRTLAYTTTFLIASTTVLYRYVFCTTEVDCDPRGFHLYWMHALFLTLAAIVYTSKIPERYVSGTFDCLGASHNLLHVFTCIGMNLKFEFIKTEIVNKRERLLNHEIQSSVYTSLLLMLAAVVLNLLICYLVEPTMTLTNGDQTVQNGNPLYGKGKKID